jgi:hypothetical protein
MYVTSLRGLVSHDPYLDNDTETFAGTDLDGGTNQDCPLPFYVLRCLYNKTSYYGKARLAPRFT